MVTLAFWQIAIVYLLPGILFGFRASRGIRQKIDDGIYGLNIQYSLTLKRILQLLVFILVCLFWLPFVMIDWGDNS